MRNTGNRESKMKYREIAGLKKKASVLAYGCGTGIMWDGTRNDAVLDASLEAGINLFDTGRAYGQSEQALGGWIKDRGIREDVIILSKCCHPVADGKDRVNRDAVLEDLEQSLRSLKTDYVDIYLVHRDDFKTPVEEIVDVLEEERKKGKIMCYGASNWTTERIRKANEYAKQVGAMGFAVNSPNFSLARQIGDPWQVGSEAISISGPDHRAEREYFAEADMSIISYSALARGLFTGKFTSDRPKEAQNYMDICAMRGFFCEENLARLLRVEQLAAKKGAGVSQIALAYLLNQPFKVHPIVHYSKIEHMESNIKAVDILLSQEEIAFLENV